MIPMPATMDRTNMGLAIRYLSNLTNLGGLGSRGKLRNLGTFISLVIYKPTSRPIIDNLLRLKADLGARKNGGVGAAVGQMGNARGRRYCTDAFFVIIVG